MSEFELDSFANIYLDAIGYREDAANLKVKLGANELEAVAHMRERLMQYLADKHGARPDTHEIKLDGKRRKLVITDKVQVPAPALTAPEPAPPAPPPA